MSTVKEEKKGIQIWEVSHKFSEKAIQAAAKSPRGGGVIAFSHPDKDVGQSISFSVDKDKYHTVSGHKLVPRDYSIEDDVLEQALQLDQIITVLTPKEISKIFSKTSSEPNDVPEPEDNADVSADDSRSSRGRAGRDEEKTGGLGDPDCPAGETFGVSIDRIGDCDDCPLYKKCGKKADALEEERKKAREERAKSGGVSKRR
jgi:hypothetical protein